MKKKLSDMKPGEKGRIVEIDSSIRASVAGMGIRTGEELKVAAEQPIGGPVVIVVRGRETSLGKGLARSIIVECEK
ncbi:MAG: ferrous iron transport protein A [Hadesarchaea archaeon]|nr:MAG: ferrous iron transport protein A [Hadesarchaea archaeon]HDI12522.1 ferrous iron transport protein A [Hadesarchaea archaeon]